MFVTTDAANIQEQYTFKKKKHHLLLREAAKWESADVQLIKVTRIR